MLLKHRTTVARVGVDLNLVNAFVVSLTNENKNLFSFWFASIPKANEVCLQKACLFF